MIGGTIGIIQGTRRNLLILGAGAASVSYNKGAGDSDTSIPTDIVLPSYSNMLSGMDRIYEVGYTDINTTEFLTGLGGTPIVEYGQSFQGNGSYIAGAFFYGITQTFAGSSSTLTFNIYAHTGTFGSTGKPTGSPLATITTDNSIIQSTTDFTYGYGYFDIPYKTTVGTNYYFTIAYSGSQGLYLGLNSGNTNIPGNGAYRTTVGGAWISDTRKMIFTLGGYDGLFGVTKYDFTNRSGVVEMGAVGYDNVGFTFVGSGSYIKKIVLRINTVYTIGKLQMAIYATSSSLPTGSALVTSSEVDLSPLVVSPLIHNFAFTFDSPIIASSGVTYAAVLLYSGGDPSVDLFLEIDADTTTPSYSGSSFRRLISNSTYSTISGVDIVFNMYTIALTEAIFGTYDFANGDQYNYIAATQNTKMAQSFTGIAGAFSKITVELRATGSPTGNVTASLFADDGGTFGTTGKPTGTALATSTAIAASSISTVSTQYTFTFASPYTMTAGTIYWIAIEYSSGSSSNKIGVVVDISSPTAPGRCAYYNGTTWAFTTYDNTGTSGATDDLCYNIYALS